MHRRDALKFFSLSSMMAISPIQSIGRIKNRVFTSEPFGLQLEIPDGWHCMLLPEYLEVLKNDYNDGNPKVPIFVCTRFKEPVDIENDTVLLFADRIRQPSIQAASSHRSFALGRQNTDMENYSFSTTTTDGRRLNFERNFFVFNDGVSNFHLEFEWDANRRQRSRQMFDDIFASFTLPRPVNAGWE